MHFDWIRFLTRMGVEYVERGPNVARNHVAITCPWCGAADHSHHLGISLQGKGWGCLRDDRHRGFAPERLVMRLGRCSWEEAHGVVRSGIAPTDVGWAEIRARITEQSGTPVGYPPMKAVKFNREFLNLESKRTLHGRFLDYLRDERGFDDPLKVVRRYNLHGALVGDFKGRLIMPVYINGMLIGWTARAIVDALVRYRAHPPGETMSSAVFNYDLCTNGGRVLAICEGPMDATKIDFYGWKSGISAVALMGLALNSAKLLLLAQLAERFDSIVLALDQNTLKQNLSFRTRLSWLGRPIQTLKLPASIKDPGDLPGQDVVDLVLGAVA